MADLLGIPLSRLTWWIWALSEKRRYTEFEIARRSGGRARLIRAPIKPIKDLQRDLAAVLGRAYKPPPHAHGYVPGRGPLTTGSRHQRQRWLLKLDISDFFPSIHFGRVCGMFTAHPFEYPEDVAITLAQLCCHKRELPQGAPTSPVISNLICRGMDKELAALARAQRCYYTRYADDICFSTNRTTFPASLAERVPGETVLGEDLISIISDHGFDINSKKTCLVPNAQRQRVTGLVVNAKVNVSRDYARSLRNLLHIWDRYGETDAVNAFERVTVPRSWPAGKGKPDFKLVVGGQIQHVGSVKGWDSPVYRKLALRMKKIDPSFPGPHGVDGGRHQLKLLTEGPTDVQHILAAQRYFHRRDEFLDVILTADEHSASNGGQGLLRRCKQLAQFPPDQLCLCLFDTDESDVLKQAVEGQSWKLWGHKAVAVTIVPPPGGKTEELCIELLHEPKVLRLEDGKGRRIHLRDEFDWTAGANSDGTRVIPRATEKTLVQENVYAMPSKNSVGLTKSDFAKAIEGRHPPFDDVSFEGFRGTFESIRSAAQALAAEH